MKKRITFLIPLLFLLIIGATGCANNSQKITHTPNTLTIGLEGTYAPYSFRDGKKLDGFEVEYGKALAKKLNLKAKFVPTKWDSLIAGLNSNTFDVVINNVSITKDRQKHFLFSDPYIFSKSVLITKENSKINSVKDLKNVKVAEGTGTDNYNKAEKFNANIIPSPDFQSTMSMIKQGRVEGTINSREAFLAWKNSSKSSQGLKYSVISDQDLPSSKIAPLFNKKSTVLRDKVSKATKALYKDGTMKKLSIKYFGADITKE